MIVKGPTAIATATATAIAIAIAHFGNVVGLLVNILLSSPISKSARQVYRETYWLIIGKILLNEMKYNDIE